MDAVTIEPLNAIVFLSEPADPGPWPIQRGITLDIPEDWTGASDRRKWTLSVSATDPGHFRVDARPDDVDARSFTPTGRLFGGVLTPARWKRFQELLPGALAILDGPDDELARRGELLQEVR